MFLRARVAVSGANFGVAETGTLTVVESEGNGRMCLTLPETLITVMGIEKVVPTWRDLEVFLQLLPRSSTGERMNPYTSTWTGVTPGDGPQEFHLVLLDNGRTRALADELGPHGPALHPLLRLPQRVPGLRAHRRPRLRLGLPGPDRRDPDAAADRRRPAATTRTTRCPTPRRLCGACYDVCPVKINIPDLLVQLRAEHTEAHADAHRLPTPEAAAMAAAAWVMADATPLRAGRAAPRRPARHGIRRGQTAPAAAAAAERVDRLPRRPEPARRDLPRLVDRATRGERS